MKIAFFCIPAYGHTNPTLAVVKELVSRNHEVRYYSYQMMKERIEETGAIFIPCDDYDIQMNLKPEDSARIGKDIAFSMEVLVNTTLALDEAVLDDMKQWQPDCIVGDSMATWGKLTALKLGIPFVSSTTTFAFNKESAKVMGQDMGQLPAMIIGMVKANRIVKRLRDKGYPVKSALSVISNDNQTDTIVYTSPEFQPYSESFSDRYAFVGPSVRKAEQTIEKTERKLLYISLGTVINKNDKFYENCFQALKDEDIDVIMTVGNLTDLEELGEIPSNFRVERSVDQIAVLQQADAFITHCGMNSTNEALYYKVPLILFPQTNEQKGVANRVAQMGAGFFLKENKVETIAQAVKEILSNDTYRREAEKIADSFYRCGGSKMAADKIEQVASSKKDY